MWPAKWSIDAICDAGAGECFAQTCSAAGSIWTTNAQRAITAPKERQKEERRVITSIEYPGGSGVACRGLVQAFPGEHADRDPHQPLQQEEEKADLGDARDDPLPRLWYRAFGGFGAGSPERGGAVYAVGKGLVHEGKSNKPEYLPAMRIVGGKYAGRDLLGPSDFRVRPTAEHVRGAVLDAIAPDIADARILDLFAGTGALGLEALSRGAESCDFVETRPSSIHALKANVIALRVKERTRLFKKDAVQFAEVLTTPDHYGIAFVDPPYESRQLDRVIKSWMANGFSKVLVCEHATKHVIPPGVKTMAFDETSVTIYRR